MRSVLCFRSPSRSLLKRACNNVLFWLPITTMESAIVQHAPFFYPNMRVRPLPSAQVRTHARPLLHSMHVLRLTLTLQRNIADISPHPPSAVLSQMHPRGNAATLTAASSLDTASSFGEHMALYARVRPGRSLNYVRRPSRAASNCPRSR